MSKIPGSLSAPQKDPGEDFQRVYTPKGVVAHLLSPQGSPNIGCLALCGRAPAYGMAWWGTGTQQEHERVKTMRLCYYCLKVLS